MTYTTYLDTLRRLSPSAFTGEKNTFITNMLRDQYIRKSLVEELAAYKYLTEPQMNILLYKNIDRYL